MVGTGIPKLKRYQILFLGFLLILINTHFVQNISANVLDSSNQTEYTMNTAQEALANANETIFQCFNLLVELELWGGDITEYALQLNLATSNLTIAYNAFFSNDYETTVEYSLSAISTSASLLPSLQAEVAQQIGMQWITMFFLPIILGIIITSTVILLMRSVKQKRKVLKKQVYVLKIRRLTSSSKAQIPNEKNGNEEERVE